MAEDEAAGVWIPGWAILAIAAALAFLFTPVAARAIAIVGVNPVSGMTMITLILACTILAATGLTGKGGQRTVLIIGCAICTAANRRPFDSMPHLQRLQIDISSLE